MNDHYWDMLIKKWLFPGNRPILRRVDMWLMGEKRKSVCEDFVVILAQISVHTGSPCDKRYCICKYFLKSDFVRYYKRIQPDCR